MKEFAIYFNDLKEEVQQSLLEFYGVDDAKELNLDSFSTWNPLFVIEYDESEE